MITDKTLWVEAQATGSWINEFDPLNFQAHLPLHKGCIAVDQHRRRRQINIITALNQALLSCDVQRRGTVLHRCVEVRPRRHQARHDLAVALLSCDQCGRSKPYLDATSASTAYGEEVEFSNFSYKRSNHFQEWLNSFQAKETTEIPESVFQRVMEELYRQRISDLNKITRKKVREVLKDLKLRKYYEHVTQITCRLNGKRPPRMTPDQEEQCRLMFMAIQGPFEKNCPPDRKNFLSYSYCLYKFCELMAYDEFLPCFSLLKGRDKLFKQDTIFKKICEELKWEFLPSI